MNGDLTLNWWAFALRGALGIVVGLVAFFLPAVTLLALTFVFAAYALIDGILSFGMAFHAARFHSHWWAFMLEGMAGIAIAAITLATPAVTLVVLLYLIAGWAVITGIFEIAAAIRIRRIVEHGWWLGLAGAASIIFGLLLFAAPGPGAVAIAWWIGAYAFVFGALMLALSFRLRAWSKSGSTLHAA
jgi:uncharacterized membrane protein HdeD (DUF308 family)